MLVGKKGEIISKYLDYDFFEMLDDAYDHVAGFNKISKNDPTLSIGYLYAVRLLVLNIMQEYSIGRI